MIKHIYKDRNYGDCTVRLVCTGEWAPGFVKTNRSYQMPKVDPDKFTTQVKHSTCPECIKLMWPKMEAEFQRVKRHVERIFNQ